MIWDSVSYFPLVRSPGQRLLSFSSAHDSLYVSEFLCFSFHDACRACVCVCICLPPLSPPSTLLSSYKVTCGMKFLVRWSGWGASTDRRFAPPTIQAGNSFRGLRVSFGFPKHIQTSTVLVWWKLTQPLPTPSTTSHQPSWSLFSTSPSQ